MQAGARPVHGSVNLVHEVLPQEHIIIILQALSLVDSYLSQPIERVRKITLVTIANRKELAKITLVAVANRKS